MGVGFKDFRKELQPQCCCVFVLELPSSLAVDGSVIPKLSSLFMFLWLLASNRANFTGASTDLDPPVIIFVFWPFDLWKCSSILGCPDQFLSAAGDSALKSLPTPSKEAGFLGSPPPSVSWTEGSNDQVLSNLLSVRRSRINIASNSVSSAADSSVRSC